MSETIETILMLVIIYIGYALAYTAGKKDIIKVFTDKIVKVCEKTTNEINNRESGIFVEDVENIDNEGEKVATVDIFSLDEIIKFYEKDLNGAIARQVTEWLKELKRRRNGTKKGGGE